MIKLGILNSRMKDFYDVWLMTRQFHFEGKKLAPAIRATFENRETPLPSGKTLFAAGIYADESVQTTMWKAFLKKNPINSAPDSFKGVAVALKNFWANPSLQLRRIKNYRAVGMLQGHGDEILVMNKKPAQYITISPKDFILHQKYPSVRVAGTTSSTISFVVVQAEKKR